MRTALLDTGPLVAVLDRRDQDHPWAVEQLAQLRRPLWTCEAVLTEAFHLLRYLPSAQVAILEMLAEDVLTVPFRLGEQPREILALVRRYANVPMSLADACLVRMSDWWPAAWSSRWTATFGSTGGTAGRRSRC